MNELDWFGHWFYAFIAMGMLYLSQKDKWGWVLRIMGEAGWIWIGVLAGWSSIYMWGTLFLLIDIKGFLDWRKADKLEKTRELVEEMANWQMAGWDGWQVVEKELDKPYEPVVFEDLDETKQREEQGKGVAEKRSRSRKKKVRSTRGRRSKSPNGVGRSGSDAKRKGSKGTRRNVRVQKDNRRANTRRPRASKA